MLAEVLEGEARGPGLLVEVQQHLLLQLVLAVVNGDRVVVTVQSVNQGLKVKNEEYCHFKKTHKQNKS